MPKSLRTMLFIGALVAWSGLALQFWVSSSLFAARGKSVLETLSRMLAYFTILTNLVVAGYYSIRLVASASSAARWLAQPPVGSAIAMYVTLVCVIVHLILRHLQVLTGNAFLADTILHYVTPILFVVFWIGWVPKRSLQWRHALWWALYPLAYFGYAMVRGAGSGFYPYPFIDVGELGYPHVLLNASLLVVAFLILMAVFIALNHRRPH